MATINVQLFANLDTEQFVKSATDGQPGPAVVLSYLDTLALVVTFVKNSADGTGIEVITDALSVSCGVGMIVNPIGSPAAGPATAGAPTSNAYPITLGMGAAILTLFAGGVSPIPEKMEFLIIGPGYQLRKQFDVTIRLPLLSGTVPDAVLPDVALTTLAARGLYVPLLGAAGMVEIKISPSGFQWALLVADDGSLYTQRVS